MKNLTNLHVLPTTSPKLPGGTRCLLVNCAELLKMTAVKREPPQGQSSFAVSYERCSMRGKVIEKRKGNVVLAGMKDIQSATGMWCARGVLYQDSNFKGVIVFARRHEAL